MTRMRDACLSNSSFSPRLPVSVSPCRSLLQPRPALSAALPVNIAAQMLVTGRTAPVIGGEYHERGDADDLQPDQRPSGDGSQEVGSFVEYRAQDHDEHGYRNSDYLPALPRFVLLRDLFIVSFVFRHRVPFVRSIIQAEVPL